MKTVYNALFVLLLLTVFSGCKEEYIGQYPVDSVAPKQVSNVQVQNMKGLCRKKMICCVLRHGMCCKME